MRAPEQPIGWPIAIAPPFGLTIGTVEVGPLHEARQRLGGEGLVELDHGEIAPTDAGAVEGALGGDTGPMP